jgi:ATP-dependent DNA helicase PIF1
MKTESNSDVAELLKKTSLIIWDEAPMVHRHGFEALDRTLKDILSCDGVDKSRLPFGGKAIVFGGDFRQILPVVPGGTRQDIVSTSLSSSYIWDNCKVLRLTKNMRLTIGSEVYDIEQTRIFAQWLLDLGEGNIGGSNDGEAIIDIPDDLLILDSLDPVSDLIQFVYPSILQRYKNPSFFQERAILAPTNEIVDDINDRLISLFPGDEKEYLSSDTICDSEHIHDGVDQCLYSPDVLNGLKISGLPNHRLVLKVGVPVMLLRNIDQKNGLCNGTRLQIISLGNHVIQAEIISGSNIGTRTFIPRIGITPSDKKIAFKFQRRQFPLAVCFAMTINKSQGQSLSRVGLFLKRPVFSHGQLYVALSRVKSRDGLKLLIVDEDGNLTNRTSNVVYKEVFRDL